MLKRLSQRQILENLAEEWERALADEWLAAIRGITSSVVLSSLIAELERGNLEAAMRMLDLSPDRFARFEAGIIQAYHAGGVATVNGMPSLRDPSGAKVNFAWGVRNTPGEANLRNHAVSFVDSLVGEQKTIARSILTEGLARGHNPAQQTARKLVGLIDRRTGLRTGGVLGNTPSVVQRLDNMFLGLRAGDPEVMKAYLTYQWRNKRFDGHVRRALAEGGSVPAEAVDRIVRAYSNKALMERGKALALTETNIAMEKAKADAFGQQIASGKLDARDLTKTWRRTVSREPRHDHLAMVGVEMPFDQKFTLPDGTQCDGPHDPSLPARHLIGCKCMVEYRINFAAQAFRLDREDGLV